MRDCLHLHLRYRNVPGTTIDYAAHLNGLKPRHAKYKRLLVGGDVHTELGGQPLPSFRRSLLLLCGHCCFCCLLLSCLVGFHDSLSQSSDYMEMSLWLVKQVY